MVACKSRRGDTPNTCRSAAAGSVQTEMTRQNGPNQPSEAFRNSLYALLRKHFEQCERQAREEVLKAAPKEVAPKIIESATSPEEDLREEERGVAPRPEPGRGGVPTRSTSEAPPSQEVGHDRALASGDQLMEGAWRVLETHMPSCLKFDDHVSLELWVRFAQWKYMISSEDPWPHYCRALREYPRRLQNPTCEVALGEEVRARLH